MPDLTHTNIFCLIGKPGSGRNTLMNKVLENSKFAEEINLKRLVYCTTRHKRYNEIPDVSFHYISQEEYLAMDKDDIIEFRSYDAFNKKTYFCFTRKIDVEIGNNYICKASPVQFINYYKWAKYTELNQPLTQIKVFPIVVTAPIFERLRRDLSTTVIDNDVYDICLDIIAEKYEYSLFIKDFPDIITDSTNRSSLVLNNEVNGAEALEELSTKMKKFMKNMISIYETRVVTN